MINHQLFNPQIINQRRPQHPLEKKILCFDPRRIIVCYDQIKKLPIPLQSVHYFLNVKSGFVIVELKQTYSTQGYLEPIELEYLFSINQNAAVTKMIVELGDQKVYGIVKEKEEAKKEYEEGINQGKTMAYSEQDEQFPEIKRVKIGALAPQKQLNITFEYIQPLDILLNKFWKLEVLPMIDEQYFKLKQNQQRKQSLYFQRVFGYLEKFVQVDQFEYNFKQDISVLIDIGSPITYYKCPTHKILSGNVKNEYVKQTIQDDNSKKLNLMLEDTPSNFIPTKQFTLLFSSDDINLPRAFLSHTNNDALISQKYCATLTFIPKFNQITLDDAYSQYLDGQNIVGNQVINRGNYLFFIDRSGSMSGARITKAKQSLILFLKSLPEDCVFNIISFGTTYRSLWSDPKQYSQETLDEAINQVEKMEANMQGTEIYNPLEKVIYNKMYAKQSSTTLNVFLLTDGEVDSEPIIELVKKKNKAETRIYTLGIGEGCSQYLIKRLAEVGNGKCQFVSDDDDINEKVIDLLEDSLTPYLKAFNLESNVTNICSIVPNPESILCLKKNQELTIQVLFSVDQLNDDLQFTLSCFDPQDQKPIKFSISLNLNNSQENEYFHKLASHKFITYYENSVKYGDNHSNFIKINKETIDEKDIINTSITYQILSTQTAFVCEVCELEDQFKQQMRKKVQVSFPKNDSPKYKTGLERHSCIPLLGIPQCSQQIQFTNSISSYKPTPKCMAPQRMQKMGIKHLIQSVVEQEFFQQNQTISTIQSQMKCRSKKIVEIEKSPPSRDMAESLQLQSMDVEDEEEDSDNQEQECVVEQLAMMKKEEKEKKKKKKPNEIQKQQILINQINYETLIKFAQANGGFSYDSKVEQQLNGQGWKNEQNYPQNIWFTLLVLLYLDQFCSDHRKSWQLVFQKGVNFLAKNGVNYKEVKDFYINKGVEQI